MSFLQFLDLFLAFHSSSGMHTRPPDLSCENRASRSWEAARCPARGRTLHLEASLASKPTGLEVGGMEGAGLREGRAGLYSLKVSLSLPSAQTRGVPPRAEGRSKSRSEHHPHLRQFMLHGIVKDADSEAPNLGSSAHHGPLASHATHRASTIPSRLENGRLPI